MPAIDAEADGIRELASEALRLRELVAASSKNLRAICRDEPAWRAMASVVGSATAARLLADSGDPRNYTSASAYEKSLGLNLKVRSSGKKKGKLALTKRGSPLARKLLFLSAMRAVQQYPLIGAWHRSKVQRDGGVRLKSITAIARKLARAVWHVARYGETFDPAKLFDARCLDLAA